MLLINGIEFFSEKEISKKYGLSVQWFRKTRLSKNSLPYYRLNRNIYYRIEEIEGWFKENLISTKNGSMIL